MIDKIKGYLAGLAGIVVFALTAAVYILLGRVSTLKTKLAKSKAEEDFKDVLVKKEEAKNEADKSEADYNTTRDKYLSEHSDS